MNILDKAYVLIAYRLLFVHADTHVNNADNIAVRVPLHTILDKLELLNVKTQIYETDGFQYQISPFENYDYEDADSIYDCIDWLEYGNLKLDKYEIKNVINNLPPKVFASINKKIVNTHDKFCNVEIIEANKRVGINSMRINLTGESFGEFILSIYRTSLQDFFEIIFIYSQRLNGIDFFNFSPLDSRVLENILQREVAKSNADNQPPVTHANPLTPQ